MAVRLEIEDLCCAYGSRRVLHDVRLAVPAGVTAVIGPNGAGKSTLVKCLAGVLRFSGSVRIDGRPVQAMPRGAYARMIGYLPQAGIGDAAFTVFEAVLLGMLDSLSLRIDAETQAKVVAILDSLGIAHLAERSLRELSGGQQQLVAVAQALVKDPRIMLLDELLNNLDIHHQFSLLKLVVAVTRQRGMTTVMVMHDLNMALKFSEHLIVVDGGRVVAAGATADVLTAELIRSLYHVDAEGCGHPDSPCFNLIDTVDTHPSPIAGASP